MPRSFPDSTQSNMFYGRAQPASGGRTWWAHIEFTRINIEPIILKNKIEDWREVSALRRSHVEYRGNGSRPLVSGPRLHSEGDLNRRHGYECLGFHALWTNSRRLPSKSATLAA